MVTSPRNQQKSMRTTPINEQCQHHCVKKRKHETLEASSFVFSVIDTKWYKPYSLEGANSSSHTDGSYYFCRFLRRFLMLFNRGNLIYLYKNQLFYNYHCLNVNFIYYVVCQKNVGVCYYSFIHDFSKVVFSFLVAHCYYATVFPHGTVHSIS